MKAITKLDLNTGAEQLRKGCTSLILDAPFFKKYTKFSKKAETEEERIKKFENKGLTRQESLAEMREEDKKIEAEDLATQKRVEVRGIEFDWIFNSKEGDLFFKELSTTKNTKLFEVDIIRDIILYLWTFYKKSLILFMFIPFMIYFAIFLTYTTWTMKRRQEETDGNTWMIVNYVFMAISSGFVALFMYYEIR